MMWIVRHNKRSRLIKAFIFSVMILALVLPAAGQKLDILYTQNSNGVLFNCQCPSEPLGGMEKRATFFKNWRESHPNTLFFDSGDFLSFNGDEANDAKMLLAMDALTYSVVNVGDQELAAGWDFFENTVRTTQLPWVATNLIPKESSLLQIPNFRTLQLAGLNILVLGVLDPDSYDYFNQIYGDFKVDAIEPITALQAAFARAGRESEFDLVILLSNLGSEADKQLVQQVDFIHVIISGHSQDQFDRPVVVNGTIINQCGKNGQYVGHLALTFEAQQLKTHSGELIPMDLSIPDDHTMLKLIKE